jgi:DNA-binding MarR family transcriptional regulator
MSKESLHLDPLIHAPVRLAILSLLMTVEEADFTYLKDHTGTSEGNLSTHLTRLEEGGLITVTKTFYKKRPRTLCTVTPEGRKRFHHYLACLEAILTPEQTE